MAGPLAAGTFPQMGMPGLLANTRAKQAWLQPSRSQGAPFGVNRQAPDARHANGISDTEEAFMEQ